MDYYQATYDGVRKVRYRSGRHCYDNELAATYQALHMIEKRIDRATKKHEKTKARLEELNR